MPVTLQTLIAPKDIRACRKYHDFNVQLRGLHMYVVDIAAKWEHLLTCDFCFTEARG